VGSADLVQAEAQQMLELKHKHLTKVSVDSDQAEVQQVLELKHKPSQ
jgi:hypothetical protein